VLALSPDGTLLASANDAGLVLSDFRARAALGPVIGESIAGIDDLAFSPDGKALLSLGRADAYLWDLDIASWREQACRVANRNLSADEWTRFIPDTPPAACARTP
jgi:hypothetical protein